MLFVRKNLPLLISFVFALLLAGFLLYPLISRGMEIFSDSTKYLNTASNLDAGYGFSLRCPPKVHPNTHWAPGYSALIALFLVSGFQWQVACKIIAILCYLFLLVGIFQYVHKVTGSFLLAFLSEASVGFHPKILRFSGAILSEPLSWICLIAISGLLTVLILKPRKKWAILLGLLLGVSMLVRYAYIPLGPFCVGVFLLLCSIIPWVQRLKLAILVSIPATIIFGGWLLRNWLLAGKTAISRPPTGTLSSNLLDGFDSWFDALFLKSFSFLQPVLWIVIAFLVVVGLISFFKRKGEETSAPNIALLVNLLLAFGYTAGLVLLRTYRATLALNDRKFTQVILLFVLMLAFAAATRYKKYISRTFLAFLALFLITSVALGVAAIPELKTRWLGYSEFESSPTIQYVIRQNLPPRRIVTNDWEAFWLWTGTCPRFFPGGRTKKMAASHFQEQGARMLVWFKRTGRPALLKRENVEFDVPVRFLEFEDGYVYQFKRRGKPGQETVVPPVPIDEPIDSSEEEED
ncbi:hypothetical protein L0156_08075 [bacterium]|nr:hypothetical protein [bacterium]